MLQKCDPVTSEFLGWRPLGITEKFRCLILACVNTSEKAAFNHHFINPLPEDVDARRLRIENAEATVTSRRMEHEAASAGGSPTAIARTAAALAAAVAALAAASRALKFVTNWCYASKGTEKLTNLVRGWCEHTPHYGLVSDDVKNMYNTTRRRPGFQFIRNRFPHLHAVTLFFYATCAVIWFGGATIPIVTAADGTSLLAAATAAAASVLCSVLGGCQGCGLATLLCVGAYHESVSAAQRACPNTNITCTADDTFIFGPLRHRHDGVEDLPDDVELLGDAYAVKRDVCLEQCGVSSVLRKTKLYSPCGDLSDMPSDLPGSPNHPTLNARIANIKIAGAFVGESAANSRDLMDLIAARLQPLDRLIAMSDGGAVGNVAQLQVNLTRLVASQIPIHWTRTMLPFETADAADYADTAVELALATIIKAEDSPADRAALALQCARLATRDGGLGSANHTPMRYPRFASSFAHSYQECCRVCPELASLATASSTTPTLSAMLDAYTRISTTLAHVRALHAILNGNSRVWVDGTKHTAYHSFLSPAYAMPDFPSILAVDGARNKTLSRCTQRKFSAIFNCEAWLQAKTACDSFDSANASASIRHREATRLISCSQVGSGAWLLRLPDPSVKGSVIPSVGFRTRCQRRLGLYVSCLRPELDERARCGFAVTQHDRLGDSFINGANHTKRHNAGLHAIFVALRAANGSSGAICLGDKGDGSESSKAEMLDRHAYLNTGHIPDIYHLGSPHTIWEYKCVTPYLPTPALGLGSPRCGGAASTADGHLFAMGNTEESQRRIVLGTKARGGAGDGPLDRHTGEGRVAQRDGHYADALSKGSAVHLLVTETTSAFSSSLDTLLRALGTATRAPDACDTTHYGSSRSSPRTFYAHHAAAVSAAVQAHESLTLENAAASLARSLLANPSPLSRALVGVTAP